MSGRQGNKYIWQAGKQAKRQGKAGLAFVWYDLLMFCAVTANVTAYDWPCIVTCWVRQADKAMNM